MIASFFICYATTLNRTRDLQSNQRKEEERVTDVERELYPMKSEAEERETNIVNTAEKNIMNNVETYTILI